MHRPAVTTVDIKQVFTIQLHQSSIKVSGNTKEVRNNHRLRMLFTLLLFLTVLTVTSGEDTRTTVRGRGTY